MSNENRLPYKNPHDILLSNCNLFDSIVLYFLPVFSLCNGYINGFEVLSRIYTSPIGKLDPFYLVSLGKNDINKSDLMLILLRKTIKFMAEKNKDGLFTNFSLHVDPEFILSEVFVDEFNCHFNQSETDMQYLTLELYFSSEIFDKQLELTITNLRNKGVKFSIDTFGCSKSDFHKISLMPVDKVKLYKGLHMYDHQYRTDVLSLVSKGISVTVVGADDNESICHFRSMGCKEGQSFLYSQAQEEADFDKCYQHVFNMRASGLLSNMTMTERNGLYDLFYSNVKELIFSNIDHLSDCSDEEIRIFLHRIKGAVMTSGFYESLKYLDDYKSTGDKKHLINLALSLDYFNDFVISKIDL